MQRFLTASLLLVTIALAGCSDGPLGPGERRALNRARDTWNARKPAEYTYEFRQSCFCPLELTVWSEVHVRNDSVVSVRPLQSLPGGFTSSLSLSAWHTVPQLFDIIEASANGDATADVKATYDPDYGYPLTIDITCPSDYLDCGATYMARNLRVETYGVIRFQLDAPLCGSALPVRFLIDGTVAAYDTLRVGIANPHTSHDVSVPPGTHVARAELYAPLTKDWHGVNDWPDKSLTVVAGQSVTDTLPFYCS